MALFTPEFSNCEAPISVIIDLTAKGDRLWHKLISDEFKSFGFNKVKDLANAPTEKINQIITWNSDLLSDFYKAVKTYGQFYVDQLDLAKLEHKNKNFVKTQEICKGMLLCFPSDLKFLLLLSASYFECKEFDTALIYLKEANDKHPNCVEVLNSLGLCYFSKSQYTEALQFSSEALSLDVSYVDAWINCAQTLTAENKTKEAETAFKMIFSFKSDLCIVHNMYAKLLLSLNRVQDAEKQYKIATKIEPKDVNSWTNLGNLYNNTDQIKKAVVCYKIALDLEDTVVTTWDYLGNAYLKLKEYQNAIDSFQRALVLSPEDINALKNSAVAYYHQQNWSLVIDFYKKVLEFQPDDLDAKLQLGLVYINNLKNYQEAEKYFKNILDLNPQEEKFHKYLIGVYQEQGKNEHSCEAAISLGDLYLARNEYVNARNAYILALRLNPDNAIGNWKMGNTMLNLGDVGKALQMFKRCLELNPNFVNAHFECGLIYEKMNFPEKALNYYEEAYERDPNNLNILKNLVNLNNKLANFDNLVNLHDLILKHANLDDYQLHFDLAFILHRRMENFANARHLYDRALKIAQTESEVLEVSLNIGDLLLDTEKGDKALEFFNKAIEIDPLCIRGHINIGSIYKDCKKFIEAINSYNTVLNIKPNFPDAYCNLVLCLRHICDWSDYDNHILKLKKIVTKQLDNDEVPSILPHHSLLFNFSPEILQQISSKYAKQFIDKASIYRKILQEDYVYQPFNVEEPIRIGYIFLNFGDHPITQLMQSILNLHDRNRFEVFSYFLSPNDDSLSWGKICTVSDHFRDISKLGVVDAANRINSDGIQILVNMNGYIKGARNEIFALRPAPIQVLWLGHPSTSGATFIDYLITDQVCSPLEFKHFYTEPLAYMNRSVFIGDHKQMNSDFSCSVHQERIILSEENTSTNNENIHTQGHYSNELVSNNNTTSMYCVKTFPGGNLKYLTRQMYNLPEGVTVFCNFNQLYKIEPSTLRMWVDILRNVPNSVLWLLRSSDSGENNIRVFAKSLNIDLSRIIFSNLEKKKEHMLRIQLADIFLDTPLFNGRMTCLDVLWAGIPVITLPGLTFASRVAASQLTTLGCTETIAQNEEDYVKIAIQLGSDKKLLKLMRSKIQLFKTKSKLFDCKSYTAELESVYQQIWETFMIKKLIC